MRLKFTSNSILVKDHLERKGVVQDENGGERNVTVHMDILTNKLFIAYDDGHTVGFEFGKLPYPYVWHEITIKE